MSALVLQNNALWHIFEDFTASILLSAFFLIYVIRNQFSNHLSTHDNKIANELSAHMTEINGILTAEIEKNEARDGSITAEIKRLLTDVYKKLSTEVNTKITNELSARLFEVNSTFTAELVRNNNELNKKLTREIAKINSRDAGYVSEAQKILSMVDNVTTRLDNIEEACRNDFGNISSEFTSIKTSIEALRNEMI
jgi:nucleoside-triphosphatase THEP1